MPDVIEVVLKLLDCVFIALAVRIIHLRPAGDSWLHQVPEMIERNCFLVALSASDPFRAWTNQAHVALEDIPKLRQLIEPEFPQPAPRTGYARIIFARVEIGCLVVQVAHEHRAELICRKNVTFAPDTRLPEDCRSAAFHPNQQENQREKRRGNQKENGRKDQVPKTL